MIGVLTVTGCSGDDDDSDDLGPQPTNEDPGPNDTSTGPTTVQGVLTIGTDPECLTLALPEGPVGLDLDGYSIADDAGQPALVADDDGRVLAHSGDTARGERPRGFGGNRRVWPGLHRREPEQRHPRAVGD